MGRKRKTARTKFSDVLCIRLTPDIYQRIKQDSLARELNMTQVVRICIKDYYRRHEPQEATV